MRLDCERVSGILTRWDLKAGGVVPREGEPFYVVRETWDTSGAEPVRTITEIKRSWRIFHRTGMVNQFAEFLLWLDQTGGSR
jgi:hypothetical protein